MCVNDFLDEIFSNVDWIEWVECFDNWRFERKMINDLISSKLFDEKLIVICRKRKFCDKRWEIRSTYKLLMFFEKTMKSRIFWNRRKMIVWREIIVISWVRMFELQKVAKNVECLISRNSVSKNLNILTKTNDIDNSLWWVTQRLKVDSINDFDINDRQWRWLIECNYSNNQLFRVLVDLTNSSMMRLQKATKIKDDTNNDKNQVKSIKVRVRQFETCDIS